MASAGTVPQTDCAAADGAGMPPHSWSCVSADKFFVREGPNYSSHKRKGRSAGALYEACGLEWYKAGRKVDGVGRMLELPETQFRHCSVPSLLVVNVQLPMESPQVFKGAKLDGPTLHAVFYFSLKEETALALENLETAEPSVRLLAEYFGRAESAPEMRTRFKALALVNNLEKVNMQRLISPFNGKPVLITESGSILRGTRTAGSGNGEGPPDAVVSAEKNESGSASASANAGAGAGASSFGAEDYLELDIHVRRWNFMARKGLHKLTPKFGSMNVSVAFLVEGRADAELPEQVLGCATINALEVAKAREIDA